MMSKQSTHNQHDYLIIIKAFDCCKLSYIEIYYPAYCALERVGHKVEFHSCSKWNFIVNLFIIENFGKYFNYCVV